MAVIRENGLNAVLHLRGLRGRVLDLPQHQVDYYLAITSKHVHCREIREAQKAINGLPPEDVILGTSPSPEST